MEKPSARDQLRTHHLSTGWQRRDSDKGVCREWRGGWVIGVPINHVGKKIRPKLLRLVQISQKEQEPFQTQTYVRIKSLIPGGSRNTWCTWGKKVESKEANDPIQFCTFTLRPEIWYPEKKFQRPCGSLSPIADGLHTNYLLQPPGNFLKLIMTRLHVQQC